MGELEVSARDRTHVLARIAALAPGQARSENFPVALRLLPRRPRTNLMRVYAYARFVDDVGDEASGDRLALLDAVEADVRTLETGTRGCLSSPRCARWSRSAEHPSSPSWT